MEITDFKVSAYRVPVATEKESDGTLEWDSTTMVFVEIKSASTHGYGYTYGHAGIGKLIEKLLSDLMGQNALDIPRIRGHMQHKIRNEGREGTSSLALAAIDLALWDLKSKLLQLPLVDLLGRARERIEIYGSGGFTSYDKAQLEKQMRGWADQGLRKFKMKVGRNPAQDADRVHFVRTCLGEEADLMVDANEAYSVAQALEMAQAFAREKVRWFEQPVDSRDWKAMAEVRSRLPAGMQLATGEYVYDSLQARQILEAGAADVFQIDVTRCQGPSGFLEVAAVCRAHRVKISSHCAPTLHRVLGLILPDFLHLEYFFDHVRIEQMFFGEGLNPQEGFLGAPESLGLGFQPHPRIMAKYEI